jgi:hypothetical protein
VANANSAQAPTQPAEDQHIVDAAGCEDTDRIGAKPMKAAWPNNTGTVADEKIERERRDREKHHPGDGFST